MAEQSEVQWEGDLPGTKANLLHRLGRDEEAAGAYQAALALSENATEQDFLAERARLHR